MVGAGGVPRLLTLLPLVALSGCSGVPLWLRLPWDVLRFSVVTILFWALLFAALGTAAAVGLFLAVRAMRGYQWGWRHAKWFRLAVLILMIIAFPLLFAVAGALQGAYVAADRILTDADSVKDVYAAVGSVGADVIGAVYVLSPQVRDAAGTFKLDAFSMDELAAFRRGEWEISVPELARRLATTDDEMLDSIARRLSAEARGRIPLLDRGLGRWVLTTTLEDVVVPALKKSARRHVDRTGAPKVSGSLLTALADEAARRGPPETISRRDISSHMVRHWIVGPVLLNPLRALIRGKQMIVLWGIGIVLLLPVVFFQIAHAIWRAVSVRPEGGGP